jgi:hypothetical protein
VAPSGSVLNKIYPDFDFSLTVNDFLKAMASRQLQGIPNLSGVPKEIKDKIINQSVLDLRNQLPGLKGLNLPDNFFDKRIDDFIYGVLVFHFNQLSSSYQTAIIFLLLAAGFFIIRSIFVLFGWAINFLGYLIFEFLIAIGFASIATETTQKETVVLI